MRVLPPLLFTSDVGGFGSYGYKENYKNAMCSITAMMTGKVLKKRLPPVPQTLANTNSLKEAFDVLTQYPGIGNYHGLQ